MKNGSVYVLGTGLSHDGSACLLKDGKIVAAVEKERITRIKHDGGNDDSAIKYCLETENITLSDLSLIVQSGGKWLFSKNQNFIGDGPDGRRAIKDKNSGVPIFSLSHHLAHAYNAIGTSPFEETAILVIDGSGQEMNCCMDLDGSIIGEAPPEGYKHLCFEKDSFYYYKNGQLKTLYKDFSPFTELWIGLAMYPIHMMHSIGDMYEQASVYCLGGGTTDRGAQKAGKLMGLAPYGRPGIYKEKMFDLKDGRVFINYDWQHQFNKPCKDHSDFKDNFQYYADIAYWVQQQTEEAVLHIINHRASLCKSKNLSYTGGVALNAVINAKITSSTPYDNLYITPSAGDNGLAIGCAYYGWMEILGKQRVLHDGSTCFGKKYTCCEIGGVVRDIQPSASLKVSRSTENVLVESARLLAKGKIIGWFQGGSEFGPRALGCRSILADPRRENIRDFINSNIKLREDFRPFAPSVLQEEVSRYFDYEGESPYMLLIVKVHEEWRSRIPSVVHRDYSSRIQTVTEMSNQLFYRLLNEFKQITGIGMLLNTSMNRRGMPIVETPADAINFFFESELDNLVIGDHILYK